MMKFRMISAALVLALVGCKQAAQKQSEAPVAVLPGSISDEMLPADRVTSQPPLDPRAPHDGTLGRDAPEPEGSDAPADAGQPAPPPPAPAKSPAPAPAPAPARPDAANGPGGGR